jgi:hypothetical protein
MTQLIHIISLGAGVQSSTMALMAAAGEITPMPQFAVFADTGDEPAAVYRHLSYLEPLLPFPIRRAARKMDYFSTPESRRLSEHIVERGFSQIPVFIRGDNGKPALGKRQCTKHWKIVPVHQKIRAVLGTTGKTMDPESVVLWQGISMDEISRMKPSRERFIKHRFPLIEMELSRAGCISWLQAKGYAIPPKSACVFCPYKDRARWREDKEIGAGEWDLIRKVDAILAPRGEFLTADLKRIDEIDFSKPIQRSEDPNQMHLFNNECEGMCGV